MTARPALLLAALLLLPALLASGPLRAAPRLPPRHSVPADARLFLSVPDGAFLRDLLLACGDCPAAVEEALAAIDGAASFSLHPEGWLLIAGSKGRTLLEPLRALGLDRVEARGDQVAASSSEALLRRALALLDRPGEGSLAEKPDFREPVEAIDQRVSGPRGLLYVADPDLLPFADLLGAESAIGFLVHEEDRWRDDVVVRAGESGLIAGLAPGSARPTCAWEETPGGTAWLGAMLTPGGAKSLALAAFGPEDAPHLVALDGLVDGRVEVRLTPEGHRLLRFELLPEADPGPLLAALGDRAKTRIIEGSSHIASRSARVLMLGSDAGALAATEAGAGGRTSYRGNAALRAFLPLLLGAETGRPGWVHWRMRRVAAGMQVVSLGEEPGPVMLATALLFRSVGR